MLLAVETSARTGSIALVADGHVIGRSDLGAPRDHGAHLAPAVERLLDQHPGSLAGYAVSAGPGSFTGLRIGFSFIKGLAMTRPAPVVALSSLRVRAASLARRRSTTHPILVVLDARAAGVYAGLFEPRWPYAAHPEMPSAAYAPDTLAAHGVFDMACVAAGDGLPILGTPSSKWDILDAEAAEPQADQVGELGWQMLAEGQGVDAGVAEPAYLVRSAPERRAAESSVKRSLV